MFLRIVLLFCITIFTGVNYVSASRDSGFLSDIRAKASQGKI